MWLPAEFGLQPVDRGMADQFHALCGIRISDGDIVIRKVLGVSLCPVAKSVGLNGLRWGASQEPGAEAFKKWQCSIQTGADTALT